MKKLLLLAFILLTGKAFASHIVGGEMNYTYLGNNQYRITLTVYRDCSSFLGFDDPAYVGIFTNGGATLTQSLELPLGQVIVLDPDFTTPCGTEPTNVCVEYTVYTTVVTLPPSATGYEIMYQRCCRNSTILNIPDPGSQGATYTAHIPASSSFPANSNPVITQPPPVYACINSPLNIDFSATDAEGDSLVYTLCTPYDGGQNGSQPEPVDFDYPLVGVTWQSPYNLSNIFGGTPALAINSQTGLLVGYPSQLGQYVLSVCVAEYRNGVYLGETKRDIQINVVDCQLSVISAFSSPTFSCDNTVTFTNGSIGATQYFWNFGDPGTTLDVSNAASPSYTYPGPGTYNVTLIALDPSLPNCTDTLVLPVTIVPANVTASFSNGAVNCGTTVNFTNNSQFANSYIWNFGDLTTNSDVSTLTNPSYTYPNPGTYSVTLIANSSGIGCSDTLVQTINIVIPTIQSAGVVDSVNTCSGIVMFGNNSTGTDTFLWNFGIPIITTDTSSAFEPSFQFPAGGTFQVELISIDTSFAHCNDTALINVSIPAPVIASFSNGPVNCGSTVNFINSSSGTNNSYAWNFGDPSTLADVSTATNPSYTYPSPNTYNVTLIASDGAGCADTLTQDITTVNPVTSVLSIDSIDFCSGIVMFGNTSSGTGSFLWDFGVPIITTDTSTHFEPTYQYTAPGTYIITLVSINTASAFCNDTSTTTITIPFPLIVNAGADAVNCAGTPAPIGTTAAYPPGTTFQWTPTAGLDDPAIQNPIADPQATTTYILVGTTPQGCTASDTVEVVVNPYPDTQVDTSLTSNCDIWTLTLSASAVDTALFDVTYIFSNGDTIVAYSVTKTFPLGDTVAVKVTFKNPNSGCDDSLMLYKLIPSLDKFFQEPVPNAFSPNGDGINDCFQPNILPQLDACYNMTIYNRWGRKVFETDAAHTCWSGEMQGDGAKASDGVYFYVLEFKGKDYHGAVHLVTGN